MSDLSIDQIKSRIKLVVGMILTAVVGITAWSVLSERGNSLDAAEKIAGGYSRALAENSDSALSEADTMLRVLRQKVREDGGLQAEHPARLLQAMRSQLGLAPQMGVLFAVDAYGKMRVNSGRNPFKRFSVADRDYFRRYLSTPDLQLSFGNSLLSRLSGHWRFNMIRPLAGPGEPFGGLIVAGFDTEFFGGFFNPGTLGPHGRLMLVRTDGVPLVETPPPARDYQSDFQTSRSFKVGPALSRSGIYYERSKLTDDQPLIVSYHRLARYPVTALVLLNQDDILVPWARKAATQSSLVFALCLVIVALTRLVCKHLDRLKLAQSTVSDQQEQLSIKAAQIDAANDSILQIDWEGRLVHFNQALCKMTGYEAAELNGRKLGDLQPPEFAARVPDNLKLIRERSQVTFESAYLAKDGTVIPVEVHARVIESGGRSQVLSVTRDITQRKHADRLELARRDILERIATGAPLDELLELIVRFVEQSIPGSFCSVLLSDGNRLRHGAAPNLPEAYNQAVDGLAIGKGKGSCGTAAFLRQRVVVEDIETHPYWKGFQPAHDHGLRACWSEPVLSAAGELLGTFALYSLEPRLPNNEELQLSASAAHLASIAIERLRGDESRRELEEQLRQSQKIEAVGQLAGGIAHDFNNLLTPIFVYADMIKRGSPENHPQIKQIESVMLAAQKASDLTRKLLSFGRKQVLCIDTLDLNEVIVSFGEIMRSTVRESISIDLRLTPEGAWVLADRGQLEQIILNLAVNAQDAIDGNGAITLETGRLVLDEEYAKLHPGVKPGPYVLFAFSDDGCGMGEETLSHIYEPFFTTKEIGRGTGLGLATVYGLVKQHEGYIEVVSRQGEGTVFKIFLPMSRNLTLPQPTAVPQPTALQNAGTGKTVLLVEDNQMIREMTEELLTGYGYRTLAAAQPLEALELAAGQGEPIDLLVTDVVMPQMNGPELYERLLDRHPRLPVLFISGYTGNVLLYKNVPEEQTNFLAKPFTLEQFLERVRRMLSA